MPRELSMKEQSSAKQNSKAHGCWREILTQNIISLALDGEE